MPEIVQEIGAAAGLAAVVGLAVLSALYFSQARDLKRLREWAGRAPERAAEQQAVGAQPQARTGAVKPVPGRATPVPSSPLAAAAGARPAAATAAAQGKQAPVPAAAASAAGAVPAAAKAATPAGSELEEAEGPPEAAPVPKPGMPTPVVTPGQGAAAAAAATGNAATGSAAAPAEAKPEEGAADTSEDGAPAAKPAEAAPAETGNGGPAKPADPKEAKPAAPDQDQSAEGESPDEEAEESADEPAEHEPQPAAVAKTPESEGTPGAPAKPGVPATPAGARPSQPGTPARPGAAPPPLPPRPAVARPGGQRPTPSQTAILPSSAEGRRPWYRRLSPRYALLAIAGVLIIGGAAAFALTQFAQEEAPAPKNERTERFARDGENGSKKKEAAAIAPSQVTVSVLNGTTVAGLAAKVGDRVEGLGFQLGNVTNNSDQSRNESVVLYLPGHQREAATVARKLRISQREPIDAASQALAGDAGVVVIAGTDQI